MAYKLSENSSQREMLWLFFEDLTYNNIMINWEAENRPFLLLKFYKKKLIFNKQYILYLTKFD